MPVPSIHHVGYVVADLHEGAGRFAQATGAGPFFAIEHMAFDEVTFRGDPAVYDHSSAFARWGDILVELTQVHDAQPPGLADALAKPGAGLGHVAWLADSLEREIDRLGRLGLVPFHTGRTGPVSAVWFDAGTLLGHPVEVLERSEPLLAFYGLVRAASEDWDGHEVLRPAPVPR